MKKIEIEPSILSADIKNIGSELKKLGNSVQSIHIDVMDGKFVPNKTDFSPSFVKKLSTNLKKTVHLMVEDPDKKIPEYVAAGADMIIFHIEASRDPIKLIKDIKKKFPKIRIGISLKPKTGIEKIMNVLEYIDYVLVMSVEPGFGGQEFIEDSTKKIEKIRKAYPNIDISVDGGIKAGTANKCKKSGANILVSGSFIFKQKDYKMAVNDLINDTKGK